MHSVVFDWHHIFYKHSLTYCTVNVEKYWDRRSDVRTESSEISTKSYLKVQIFFSIDQAISIRALSYDSHMKRKVCKLNW